MKIQIQEDEITKRICEIFTIEHNGSIEFKEHVIDEKFMPKKYNIGLIVGNSGTGKSTLLKTFGFLTKKYDWENNKAIASHFKNYEEAEERLMGVGLSSIPTWLKPYSVLSNGEKHRADLAITLSSNMIIDEFVSYVDNDTALSLANSIQKFIRKKRLKNIIFATLNKEIIEYLQPDWYYNTNDKEFVINTNKYNIKVDKENNYFMEIG